MDPKDIIKHIAPLMKKKGFIRKGKLFFLIKNDIAFCLEFEKPSQYVYMAYYVVPLYIPHENRCFTYGKRVNLESILMCGDRFQSQHSFDEENQYKNIVSHIESSAIPLFESFGTTSRLIQYAKSNKSNDCDLCNDVLRLRLLFFTYVFIKEYNEALETAIRYRVVLQTAQWLTTVVKEQWIKEIDDICIMLQEKPGEVSAWNNQVIANTLTACSLNGY